MNPIEDFPKYLLEQYNEFRKEVPSITKANRFIDNLIYFLFPFKADKKCTQALIELNLAQLQIDLKDIMVPLESILTEPVSVISEKFFRTILFIHRLHHKTQKKLSKAISF